MQLITSLSSAAADTLAPLPQQILALGKKILWRAVGAALCFYAATLLLALLSYSPADESWNSSGAGEIQNWLGAYGAVIADSAWQWLGVAALMLVPLTAAWGWRAVRGERLRLAYLRIPAALVGLGCLAAALTIWLAGFNLGVTGRAGGVLGAVLAGQLSLLLPDAFAPLVIAVVLPALALLCFWFALTLQRAEWFYLHAALLAPYRWGMGYVDHWRGRAEHPALRGPQLNPLDVQELGDPTDDYYLDNNDDRDDEEDEEEEQYKPAPRRRAKKRKAQDEEDIIPPTDLLQEAPASRAAQQTAEQLRQSAELLASSLDEFGVQGQIVGTHPGPVVTLYELEPAPGTRAARVVGLSDDIARQMCARAVRVAVVPGRNAIGIELPNAKRETVYLRELLENDVYAESSAALPLVLGKDIGGAPIVVDLARMPHLLVAGTTGSGKSVAINAMILSLLYKLPPEKCRLIMVDPKMLELSVYEGIPHLLTPVVTEPKKAILALKWAVREMEDRYRAMSKLGVRNIDGYNQRLAEARTSGEVLLRRVQTGFDPDTGKPVFEDQPLDLTDLPYIVVVVDEMADLMLVAGKDIEAAIQRLAQMARAAGIHLIMATQRPSVDVITGTIKANFPTRISFQVTSKIDSRTILGEQGAEQLLGMGDMLYMAGGGRIMRVHGPFVRDDEVEAVVSYLKARGEPVYIDEVTEEEPEFGAGGDGDGSGDEMYDKAVALVARERKASTSFIQRHLNIGFNRAAKIMDRMEAEGVVSSANHVGKREVLVGGR